MSESLISPEQLKAAIDLKAGQLGLDYKNPGRDISLARALSQVGKMIDGSRQPDKGFVEGSISALVDSGEEQNIRMAIRLIEAYEKAEQGQAAIEPEPIEAGEQQQTIEPEPELQIEPEPALAVEPEPEPALEPELEPEPTLAVEPELQIEPAAAELGPEPVVQIEPGPAPATPETTRAKIEALLFNKGQQEKTQARLAGLRIFLKGAIDKLGWQRLSKMLKREAPVEPEPAPTTTETTPTGEQTAQELKAEAMKIGIDLKPSVDIPSADEIEKAEEFVMGVLLNKGPRLSSTVESQFLSQLLYADGEGNFSAENQDLVRDYLAAVSKGEITLPTQEPAEAGGEATDQVADDAEYPEEARGLFAGPKRFLNKIRENAGRKGREKAAAAETQRQELVTFANQMEVDAVRQAVAVVEGDQMDLARDTRMVLALYNSSRAETTGSTLRDLFQGLRQLNINLQGETGELPFELIALLPEEQKAKVEKKKEAPEKKDRKPFGERIKGFFERLNPRRIAEAMWKSKVDRFDAVQAEAKGKFDYTAIPDADLDQWQKRFETGLDLKGNQGVDNATLANQVVTLFLRDKIGTSTMFGKHRKILEAAGYDQQALIELKKNLRERQLREEAKDGWQGKLKLANRKIFEFLQRMSPFSVNIDRFGNYNNTGYDKEDVTSFKDFLKRNLTLPTKGLSADGRTAAWYVGYVGTFVGMEAFKPAFKALKLALSAGTTASTWAIEMAKTQYEGKEEAWDEFAEKSVSAKVGVGLMKWASARSTSGPLRKFLLGDPYRRGAIAGMSSAAQVESLINVLDMAFDVRSKFDQSVEEFMEKRLSEAEVEEAPATNLEGTPVNETVPPTGTGAEPEEQLPATGAQDPTVERLDGDEEGAGSVAGPDTETIPGDVEPKVPEMTRGDESGGIAKVIEDATDTGEIPTLDNLAELTDQVNPRELGAPEGGGWTLYGWLRGDTSNFPAVEGAHHGNAFANLMTRVVQRMNPDGFNQDNIGMDQNFNVMNGEARRKIFEAMEKAIAKQLAGESLTEVEQVLYEGYKYLPTPEQLSDAQIDQMLEAVAGT
jgi:hypothetical protein